MTTRINELRHDKTNNVTVCPAKTQISLASAQSDLVGLQYTDKKRSCQPDLVDLKIPIICLNKWLKINDLINL